MGFFMSPRSARHAVLSEISPFDGDGDVRIVIETPRGSRSKYSYDPECDCMQLSTVLPEGMVFPYDFGFIPSTLGEDGDPLDILVLMEASVIPGCCAALTTATRLAGPSATNPVLPSRVMLIPTA
jgi:inorganic pyrophosphatase